MTFKTKSGNFRYTIMTELAEHTPVHNLLHWTKNHKVLKKNMLLSLSVGKKILEIRWCPDKSWIYSILRTKKTLFTGIVDQSLRNSRLLCPDMVLSCLNGVGLKRVSWAVLYFNKPIQAYLSICQHISKDRRTNKPYRRGLLSVMA